MAERMREEVLHPEFDRVPGRAYADAVELPGQALQAEPREKRARRGVELLADAVEPVADEHDVPAGATERDRRRASGRPGADDRDAHQVGNSLSVSTLKSGGKAGSPVPAAR